MGWEGPTRALAVVRIVVATLLMQRYSQSMALFNWDSGPIELVAAAGFYLLLVFFLLGLFSRITIPAFALLMTLHWGYFGVTLGHRPSASFIGPWLVTSLLAFTPCGKSFSLDRYLEVRRAQRAGAPIPPETGPLWAVPLLWLQVTTMYLFAAIDKTDAQWLAGERMERIYMFFYGGSESFLHEPWMHPIAVGMAWLTTGTEFGLAIGLWIRPVRRYLIPVGLVLHAGFWVLLGLWPLSGRMWVLYILFADPQRVHDFFETVFGRPAEEATE